MPSTFCIVSLAPYSTIPPRSSRAFANRIPADAERSVRPDGWAARRTLPTTMPPSEAQSSGERPAVRRADCSEAHAIAPVRARPGARSATKSTASGRLRRVSSAQWKPSGGSGPCADMTREKAGRGAAGRDGIVCGSVKSAAEAVTSWRCQIERPPTPPAAPGARSALHSALSRLPLALKKNTSPYRCGASHGLAAPSPAPIVRAILDPRRGHVPTIARSIDVPEEVGRVGLDETGDALQLRPLVGRPEVSAHLGVPDLAPPGGGKAGLAEGSSAAVLAPRGEVDPAGAPEGDL
eukprot:scaffold34877_cov90-Isochrysis_galbana.AAC.2